MNIIYIYIYLYIRYINVCSNFHGLQFLRLVSAFLGLWLRHLDTLEKGPKHKPLIYALFNGNLMILTGFLWYSLGFYRMSWNFYEYVMAPYGYMRPKNEQIHDSVQFWDVLRVLWYKQMEGFKDARCMVWGSPLQKSCQSGIFQRGCLGGHLVYSTLLQDRYQFTHIDQNCEIHITSSYYKYWSC